MVYVFGRVLHFFRQDDIITLNKGPVIYSYDPKIKVINQRS